MFHVPNKDRIRKGPLASDDSYGNNGAFYTYFNPTMGLQIIASDQCGWEHVSVTAIVRKNTYPRTPTWREMCKVKNLFWDEEDVVVQFHPRKSEYVDNHKYCLHLWRKKGVDIETPPIELV